MSPADESALIGSGAAGFGLALTPAQLQALSRLLDALQAANAQFNLTAIRDRPGMVRKHVLDSLSVQPYLHGSRIADVGTGAGFPGLPLAIANPALHFTLIESTGKKARYVEHCVAQLALANVTVVHDRAESYRPAQRFDTVIARALSSLEAFVGFAAHLCAPGGRILAMKGRRPDEEIAALPRGYQVLGVHRLAVPGLPDERHLIEIARASR